MLLERPLSLKLIFHYYNQINRQRDRIIWMTDVLTIFFSLFHFTVFVAGLFLFSFFFFFFSSSTFHCLPLFFLLLFLSFFSCRSIPLFVAGLFLFFLFTSFNSSIFLCPFRWCTVTRFVLSPWKTLLAQAPNRDMLYCNLQHHNDTINFIHSVIYSSTASQRHNN